MKRPKNRKGKRMTRIVAGLFDDQESADAALARLHEAAVPREATTSFFVNPPGMHDGTSIGGDVDADPQARGGEEGAVQGAGLGGAAGIAVGLVTVPLVGPVGIAAGIGAGAFVGSLAGATSAMADEGPQSAPISRPSGIMVAVNADGVPEQLAIRSLEASGARMVEVDDGDWAGGTWPDFDALNPPRNVVSTRDASDYPT